MWSVGYRFLLIAALLAAGTCVSVPLGCGDDRSQAREARAGSPAPPELLRVVTYNVLKGTPVDQTIVALADLDADVIFLQEVDRSTARSGGVDQSGHLHAALAEHAVYATSVTEDGGEFGTMILSRYPLSSVRPLDFHTSRVVGVAATLHVGDRRVALYCVHLSATYRLSVEHAWKSTRDRRAEAYLLAEQLKRVDRGLPVILAGDMNAFPGTYEYAQIAAQLTDSALHVGEDHPTLPAQNSVWRVDYIFTSGHFAPLSVFTRRGASDHLMVIAELQWAD